MPLGDYSKRVSLFRSPQVSGDSDGFFEALNPPKAWASIEPLPPGASEDRSIQSEVRMRWHPQVTLDTWIRFNGRDLRVRGVQNVGEDNTELRLICEEVQP